MKLPQLTSMDPSPTFTEIKTKTVAGTLYTIIYDQPTFYAEISGLCQSWTKNITLTDTQFNFKN